MNQVIHTPRTPWVAERLGVPRFPPTTEMNGRLYVLRSDFERYKVELIAFAQGVEPTAPPPVNPDFFVPMRQVAAELGVGRRTIGRRIKLSQTTRVEEAA
jgi:hypothetical protein